MAAAGSIRPLLPNYSMRMEKRAYRISNSRYSPCPASVRNPKIAVQMNGMHDTWFAAKFESKPASPT